MRQIIGILGGTFDPPHNGHVFIAESFTSILGLKAVCLMPNFIPPHKAPAVASDRDRLAMIRLLCDGNEKFLCLDDEIRRQDVSYLSQTLQRLAEKEMFQNLCMVFIMGADSLEAFHTWHRPDEILRLCNLAVASRPGCAMRSPRDEINRRIIGLENFDPDRNGQIVAVKTEEIPLSSTQLRNNPQLISESTVPPPVLSYIRRHHLYHA
ncbi:MAG: nicotinate (nicotinamide) nucleotide adenylyltransferase [Succinivibrionaceae bacterium]|nr:nicotinate (nicotinamide) nucleotide adenylyltransferase [Succinivibrionaceae bacterium]